MKTRHASIEGASQPFASRPASAPGPDRATRRAGWLSTSDEPDRTGMLVALSILAASVFGMTIALAYFVVFA